MLTDSDCIDSDGEVDWGSIVPHWHKRKSKIATDCDSAHTYTRKWTTLEFDETERVSELVPMLRKLAVQRIVRV